MMVECTPILHDLIIPSGAKGLMVLVKIGADDVVAYRHHIQRAVRRGYNDILPPKYALLH